MSRLAVSIARAGVFAALAVPTCAAAGGLSLRSPAFAAGAPIPQRFSCQGAGISPPLSWSGLPSKTRSVALIVDDPDAPGGIFTHWVVYNIAADRHALAADAATKGLPKPATSADNSAGETGYHGVCPPSGMHHYVFKLYALDARLPEGLADKAAVVDAMQGHVVARTRFTATYREH